jgi:hypothetical protein
VEEDESSAKPALVNDRVSENTAIRTGQASRGELTFKDLTITRLGENTIFTFNKAGRDVQLNAGSVLLYVPKNSGGAHMATDAVSIAITGTTVILRAKPNGRNVLIALEDGARVSLIKYPRESVYVREGQLVDVPAGAIKMPKPVNINLRLARNTPLITDFPPLPSQNLTTAWPNRPKGRQPHSSGGRPLGPVTGNPVGSGSGPVVGPGQSGAGGTAVSPGGPIKTRTPHTPNSPSGTPTPAPSPRGTGGKGNTGNTGTIGNQPGGSQVPRGGPKKPKKRVPKPKPTPTPPGPI